MEGVEEFKAAIFDAFRSAAPHLCEPSRIRELLEEVVKQARSIEGAIAKLQEEMAKCSAATERTDLKILLLFLEKELRKRET